MRRLFKSFGDYLVADPRICHGQWTFRGTRIFVSDVLDQLAARMSWKKIGREWDGRVSPKAISEAVLLGKDLLFHDGSAVRKSMINIKRRFGVLSHCTGRGNRATGGTPVLRKR
jgi:uncharacterized protein (DUF433 family)